jgi:hypothetical protein
MAGDSFGDTLCLWTCARDGMRWYAFNRPHADDLANPNIGFEKHPTYEVLTVGFRVGSVFGWRIGVGWVEPQQGHIGAHVVHKPPHRVGDARRGGGRYPHVERAKVVECGAQIHSGDAVVSP